MKRMYRFCTSILGFLTVILLVRCTNAQSPESASESAPDSPQTHSHTHTPFDTLHMNDFTHPQRQAWDAATKDWYEKEYFATCINPAGYKINCTDCTNLGLRLQIQVDATGNITETKELENKIYCHHTDEEDAKVHDCLLQSFPKVHLPEPFHNKILIVFVGRVPSC